VDIDFAEWEAEEPALPAWLAYARVPPERIARRRAVLAELGRALLQLRLFRGWSQQDLERSSGVDQTTISRFERAEEGGLSIHRLAAMLDALKAGRVDFLPPPGPPPTALELMLHGDGWKRAGAAADLRLARPKRRRR
jgi:transcriptional regulator with XRE-family HTH domain